MWTVIYVSKDNTLIEKLKYELESKNILVKVKNVSQNQDEECYEVMVPESEIDKAHDIIINIGF